MARARSRTPLPDAQPVARPQTKPRSFLATGASIVRRETPLALYKGLGAVLSGIVPKMAIRFASFEQYKSFLRDRESGRTSAGRVFIGAPLSSPRMRRGAGAGSRGAQRALARA